VHSQRKRQKSSVETTAGDSSVDVDMTLSVQGTCGQGEDSVTRSTIIDVWVRTKREFTRTQREYNKHSMLASQFDLEHSQQPIDTSFGYDKVAEDNRSMANEWYAKLVKWQNRIVQLQACAAAWGMKLQVPHKSKTPGTASLTSKSPPRIRATKPRSSSMQASAAVPVMATISPTPLGIPGIDYPVMATSVYIETDPSAPDYHDYDDYPPAATIASPATVATTPSIARTPKFHPKKAPAPAQAPAAAPAAPAAAQPKSSVVKNEFTRKRIRDSDSEEDNVDQAADDTIDVESSESNMNVGAAPTTGLEEDVDLNTDSDEESETTDDPVILAQMMNNRAELHAALDAIKNMR